MQNGVTTDPVMLLPKELIWLNDLIKQDQQHTFYVWRKWLAERAFVLEQDKYECQMCKVKGRYRRAVLVHHIEHLRKRPDLALKMWVDEGNKTYKRQLVSLCRECHELCHPERGIKQSVKKTVYMNFERWD